MRNIAFIPVRGGSKSIHMKNIKSIAGKPLVWWTASAASECGEIETVYVATDSDEIKESGWTADELIDDLESRNGDGCDYIVELRNLATGEVLLDAPDLGY